MTHRQLLTRVVVLGVSAMVCAVAAPHQAVAAAGTPVHIEAATSFDPAVVNTFTSDIAGCEAGSVTEGRVAVSRGRGRIFAFSGEKTFSCDSGETFTVQLSARFPVGPGSVGNWAVLSSSDDLGFSTGSGTLVGFGTSDGILDVYDGTLR